MAIGWGGFASGLTAGSNAAANAYKARADYEDQMYKQEERQRERETRAEYETAGASAETQQRTGYRMVDPQGNTYFVPEADKDYFSAVQTAEGKPLYTPGEVPTAYSETRIKGGKLLRQSEISPEHAELAYDPNRGLQEQYNDPTARNKRLLDVAVRRGKFADAASISGLTANELNQILTRAKIEDIPQERRAREVTIRHGEEQVTAAVRTNAQNKAADQWRIASESEPAALEHYNKNCPDGNCARVAVDERTGMRQIMVKNEQGVETPVGKPYPTWEKGGKQNILSNIPALADLQVKAEIEHPFKIKEIEATGKWHLDYARILAAARGQAGPSKQDIAAFQKEHDEAMKLYKAGELSYEDALERVNLAGAKIGRPIPLPKESKLDSMPYSDRKALRDDALAELSKDQKFKDIPKTEAGEAARKALIRAKEEELLTGGPGNVRGSRGRTKTGDSSSTTPEFRYPAQWGGSGGGPRPAPGSPIISGGPFDTSRLDLGSIRTPTGTVVPPPPRQIQDFSGYGSVTGTSLTPNLDWLPSAESVYGADPRLRLR